MKQQFGPYSVEIGNREKVFYPGDGITKGDVIDYYRRVADRLIPHLKDRPVTLERYPDGIDEEGFIQKKFPDYFPDWFDRKRVATEQGQQTVPVCNNLASLVYLANQGSVTQHVWLSRVDRPDIPDQMIFDLDPPGDDFSSVVGAARDCLELLDELALTGFVKTTGSRGLHVMVPLRRLWNFDAVRDFARDCARVLVDRFPDRYTLEHRIENRRGRLYLDVLRNAYGQTVVAPYSLRPKAGAPVATPLERDALSNPELSAQSYRLDNIFQYLGQKNAPWSGMRRHARGLPSAANKLARILQA